MALDAIGAPSTPLLEEERGASGIGLSLHVGDPFFAHGSSLGAGFAADDHPMDVAQVDAAQVFQQRLDRKEADVSVDLAQVVNARNAVLLVLHRHAEPHVLRARAAGEVLGQSFRSLGEDLIRVVRRVLDDREHVVKEAVRHVLVEQVTHAVDEIRGRLLSRQWLIKPALMHREPELVLVARRAHGVQSARHHFGVAMLASRRDLGAACRGIPCLLCPFDG